MIGKEIARLYNVIMTHKCLTSCYLSSYLNNNLIKVVYFQKYRLTIEFRDNLTFFFDVLLTVHLRIILVINQLKAQITVLQYVYYKPLHVSSIMWSSPGGKNLLYSIWYHHTCSNLPTKCTNSCFIISLLYSSKCFEHCCAHHQEVKIVLYSIWYHHTCRCDDTRCCII